MLKFMGKSKACTSNPALWALIFWLKGKPIYTNVDTGILTNVLGSSEPASRPGPILVA